MRSSASSCYFHYLHEPLNSSSSCLRLLSRLAVPSIFPSLSSSIAILKGGSYTRCDQYSYPSFYLLYVGCFFPLWLFVILLYFSHDRSNWSPSFSSTTFRNFQCIFYLLSELSTFLCHRKLLSKRSILLVSSSYLRQNCWRQECWGLRFSGYCAKFIGC